MKKRFMFVCAAALALASCSQPASENKEMSRYIDDLMSKMTIEEKIGQLNLLGGGDITTGQAKNSNTAERVRAGEVGGLFNIKGVEKIKEVQKIAVEETTHKIPLLFGMDVIHGYETVFPIPLGLAATWDMQAIEESARVGAVEASAAGISWTFSPMVDVSRDARWGRVSEGNGEDPYLGGEIAKAMVYGYQGRGAEQYSTNSHIMACVKHYALYGAGEAGRDYNTVDMSRVRMFNEYMYPYQAAVEAGVGSVMASFNEIDGIPATANKWLMQDILRDQWGFDGFVVTDYTGINEMIDHGIGDLQAVSARALEAGIDMDMVGEGFFTTLKKSLDEGKVTEKQIDLACRRVLEAKYKLGLFQDPYKYIDVEREKKDIYSPEHRAIARRISAESFVLLKNEKQTLPIAKKGRIAVIGPLGNTKSNMHGTWSVAADLEKPLTVVEGLQEVLGNSAEVLYAKGSNLEEDATLEKHATMFGRDLHRDNRSEEAIRNEALALARRSDVIIATLGEASEYSGEASSRSEIGIPAIQQRLLKELLKTGKPVVLVAFAGRPLTLTWEHDNVPAILYTWFGGSEAALAIADVLVGDVNPSGKTAATFPQNVGQIPVYYNHKNTGRPLGEGKWFEKFRSNYIDVPNEPLYPFGYGLSYTTFEYGDLKLSKDKMSANDEITASITVSNTGKYDGKEVVQLYIRDIVGSTTRPVKELKGFEKVMIKAGESKTIEFKINGEMLKFYNYDLDFVSEPGDFDVMIGGNSAQVKKATFTLQ